MKLKQRNEKNPHLRSRDLLTQETQPESGFFDPRIDFPPEELARLKQLASDQHERTVLLGAPDDLVDAWWLSLFDKEFQQLLLIDPEFKSAVLAKFDSFYSHELGRKELRPESILAHILPLIQMFPEQRNYLRAEYFDKLMPQFLLNDVPNPKFWRSITMVSGLIQVYPERRAEFLQLFSIRPNEVIQHLSEMLNATSFTEVRTKIVADTLLVFPELRPDILALLRGHDLAEWKKKFKTEKLPLQRSAYEFSFNLTIIGAESAKVDETGQIRLELRGRSGQSARPALPERSSA